MDIDTKQLINKGTNSETMKRSKQWYTQTMDRERQWQWSTTK